MAALPRLFVTRKTFHPVRVEGLFHGLTCCVLHIQEVLVYAQVIV